jgi:hypothetical protein
LIVDSAEPDESILLNAVRRGDGVVARVASSEKIQPQRVELDQLLHLARRDHARGVLRAERWHERTNERHGAQPQGDPFHKWTKSHGWKPGWLNDSFEGALHEISSDLVLGSLSSLDVSRGRHHRNRAREWLGAK